MVRVLLDGFHVDTVELETPISTINFVDAVLTPKVRDIIKEEERVVVSVFPVPEDSPRVVLITTELEL